MEAKKKLRLHLNDLSYIPPKNYYVPTTTSKLHNMLRQSFKVRKFGTVRSMPNIPLSSDTKQFPKGIKAAVSFSTQFSRKNINVSSEQQLSREYKSLLESNQLRSEAKEKILDSAINAVTGNFDSEKAAPLEINRTKHKKGLQKEIIGFLNAKSKKEGETEQKEIFEEIEKNLSAPVFIPNDISILLTQTTNLEATKSPSQRSLESQHTVADVEKVRNRLQKGVNSYLSEIDALHRKLNTLGSEREENLTIIRKFYEAVKEGSLENVILMLEKYPNLISQRFSLKETALHIACKLGNAKLTAKLLEKGADTNSKDFLGRTPKDLAEKHHHNRMVQLLEAWEKYGLIPAFYIFRT